MGERGIRPEAQFAYWDMRRRGATQSDIARSHGISRQAVNKSIKLAERDILYRLLENAQTSNILVEWQDAAAGVLVGISPQLGNLGCIMIVDGENRIRLFYDQDRNSDRVSREKTMREMDDLFARVLQLKVSSSEGFRATLVKIVRRKHT